MSLKPVFRNSCGVSLRQANCRRFLKIRSADPKVRQACTSCSFFSFTFDSQKCRIRFLKVRAFLSEVRQVCCEKEDLRPESPDRKTKTRKRRPPQIGGT